ncbi:MAG: gliding motility lipoprotein GldH [Bacteroidales bacterium]|jgi:gliding motility-associated lipoprotein GldH|nr:gliding motility lipoprotein GldH [Bacteroidales bacterium]
MKNSKIYIFIFLIAICLSACNKKYVTDKYYSIPKEGWSYFDTLDYQFSIDDTDAIYSVFLNVIHNDDYKYRNLFLFMHRLNPDSSLFCDTVQLILSTPEGTLLGKGIGETKEAKFLLGNNIKFPEQGNYSLQLIHGMRDEYIFGIEKVGFIISK